MYYALIIISVVMFGFCFAMNDAYRKLRSSSFLSSMESAFVGAVSGLIVLLMINGFDFETTPFTLFIAVLCAINGIAFTFCSFKALDSTNLSLYSLFSMLGGMALPFFQGIVFYGEKITLSKIVCFILICVSLLLTVSKRKSKGGIIYYTAVFVLNGLSGVLSKIFTSAPFKKASAESFSIWIAVFTALISGIIWLYLLLKNKKLPKYTLKPFVISSLNGFVNRIANLLLVVSLLHIDASVQYPVVTGGVIIVSSVIGIISKNKPSKRELLAVLVAFLGALAVFVIKC